jgi:hypothetical protein
LSVASLRAKVKGLFQFNWGELPTPFLQLANS